MAARQNIEPKDKTRIQVVCSRQQRQVLEDAAKATGSEFSVWVMAHLLVDAGKQNVAAAPAIIAGDVADRLRASAQKQGVTPERLLEQLLAIGG
jgi:uncharacterized protein (DUF1778 family)